MDNLEYYNGAAPPSILDNINKKENNDSQTKEKDANEEKISTEETPKIEEKPLPMPPTNTNFKAISAAALVASRRKVF